jgi:cell division transport system permease protein
MPYSLREAFAAFRRAPLLVTLSVFAIGFSLYVVGIFGLTAYNVSRAIDQIEERVEVVAYLRDSVTPEQVQAAEAELHGMPEVASVRYVSKHEALAEAVQKLEEFQEVFSDLEANPLPASIELRLAAGHRSPASVQGVADVLGAYPFVDDVRYGRDWLEKIVFLRRIAGGAAAVIGGAFALVAAIIIGTAIRIAVFARRDEISIMRLVGATNGFVRRPFVIEGLMTGLLGGCLAVVLTFATFRFVNASLLQIHWLPPGWAAASVATGAAFGLLASAAALRRHLGAL